MFSQQWAEFAKSLRQKKRPDFWGSGLLPLSVTGGSVAAAIPWELC
jgi:hypothetical protein